MEPIVIETGKKLVKFWTMFRLILNGISICIIIIIGDQVLHYDEIRISFLIISYLVGVAIAQFQHYLKVITEAYGINKFGLYLYQNSFKSGKASTQICEISELQPVKVITDPKKMFQYFLEIKAPNETINIPIEHGEKVARDLERKINMFIEFRNSDPRSNTELAINSLIKWSRYKPTL
jgi:hypothetical protein